MSTQTSTLVNGIDVDALRGAIESVKAEPAAGRTQWKVSSAWKGGSRADHHVAGYGLDGRWIARPFTLKTDEPLELCGQNLHANPQEYLLSALNACMIVGFATGAALMGIELDSLEIEVSGDIDLRGFMGLDASVPAGYPRLEQVVRIRSQASPEQLRQLHEAVLATSPNWFNVTRPVPTRSTLVVA